MQILERIADQINSTGWPLFAVTLAAVPCPDTPVILTLHWHAFIKERLADDEAAGTVTFSPVPSSALQLNERWNDLLALDYAAMEAAWALGAWDVARAERRGCLRAGAASSEALACLQAFGAFPFGVDGNQAVVADAPETDELLRVAARAGYLMWLFRPVHGGIWYGYADDATLGKDGGRDLPCPYHPVPPSCEGDRRTVYRFGVATGGDTARPSTIRYAPEI